MNRCELKYLQYTDEKSSQIKRESYDDLGNKIFVARPGCWSGSGYMG